MSRILVIDDNETMREGMALSIRKMGHTVDTASGGRQGVSMYAPDEIDFVITDLKMDDLDGLGVIKALKEIEPNVLVMVVTAFGTIEVAVDAMRAGAYDFIPKPFSKDLLCAKVDKALATRALSLQHARLHDENQMLRDELAAPYGKNEMIGDSAVMQRVYKLMTKVAASDSTVHIFGESGTGKELVARFIHENSPRKDGPFIKLSCSSLTESLLESELFGHEKGSFTGAIKQKRGRFELADGGTLFLDEIGEISPAVQVKLLRVLQEKEIERVGSEKTLQVDVRIVSATNKDLQEEVDERRFREDLFYRLHILPVNLPPLRNRLDDVEALVEHFLEKLRPRTRHSIDKVAPETIEMLKQYRWPGNIRELENAMEQALVLADGDTLLPEDLPAHISRKKKPTSASSDNLFQALDDLSLPQLLDDIERKLILEAFQNAKGVKTETARHLGIKTSALYYKLEKYGIS